MKEIEYQDKFFTKYYIEKYSNVRNKPSDLFQTEKYFLPRVILPNSKILDIGCAIGGFSEILLSYESNIKYFGIDISIGMINAAKKKYPKHNFQVISNKSLIGFEKDSFDLVQCWGVSVHEPDYRKLITESWRVSDRAVIFDMRLKKKGREIINENICFTLNPGGIKYDYVIANMYDFINFLINLDPKPKLIEIIGYIAKPNKFSSIPKEFGDIYMCGVGVYKSDVPNNKDIELKLRLPDKAFNFLLKNMKNMKNMKISRN